MAERRSLDRRQFSYYMRVMDEGTGQLLGHLTDISASGFKLDCQKPLPVNTRYVLHLDLNSEVATKQFMVFSATSRWCRPDRFDPTAFDVGFQILEMTPGDMDVFVRMFEKYGSPNKGSDKSNTDYMWR